MEVDSIAVGERSGLIPHAIAAIMDGEAAKITTDFSNTPGVPRRVRIFELSLPDAPFCCALTDLFDGIKGCGTYPMIEQPAGKATFKASRPLWQGISLYDTTTI